MPSYKNYIQLSEGVEKIIDYRGKTPRKLGSDWVDKGIRTISAKNVHNGVLDNIDSIRCVTEEIYEKWMKDKIKREDIFIVSEGASMGESLIWESDEQIVLGQRLFAVRANNKVLNPFYLAMYMRTPEYRAELINHCTGTSVMGLSQPSLLKTKIRYVPINLQNFIGEMYQNICNKIENNNKINRNLFKQAREIYKSWFMDFNITDGVMPENWHVGTVEEIIELHDSLRKPLSGKEREKLDKIYPYYGATSIMDYVDSYLFDGIYLLLGEDGSVVDTDGFPILQYVFGKFWVNNHAHIITGKNGFSVESLYLLFSLTHVNNIVTGAVQLKISQQNLKKVEAIIPSQKALKDFDEIIQPMFAQIRKLKRENENLTSFRDLLLPKLMSGELDISALNI